MEALELEKKPPGLRLGPPMFSLMNLLIIVAASYLIWIIFADPVHSPWKTYPQPFGVVLFWSILFVVFFAFLGQLWGLGPRPQPVSGAIWILLTTVFAVIVPSVLLHGYGVMDPAFDIGKGGYTATTMIVLIGFYTWGILGTSMGHWPWVDLGLKQPRVGIGGFLFGFVLTFLGYILLIYPSLASWTSPDKTILPLTVVIGWFYSVIVSWLTTFLILDNWPWSAFGSRAKTAFAALVGNFVVGTGIYFAFHALLRGILLPQDVQAALGPAIDIWPAHLGVCVSFWLIFWANVAGNPPTGLGPIANRLVRLVITFSLAVATFVVYTRWFAVSVLNEKEIAAGFGGDPLTWIDLMIYVMLVYVIYLGSYGLNRKS